MVKNNNEQLAEHSIPYFSYDRKLSVHDIKNKIKVAKGFERYRLMAWIMREAAFSDVWQFFTPQEIDKHISRIEPLLGRKKNFWKYILGAWHELGKF